MPYFCKRKDTLIALLFMLALSACTTSLNSKSAELMPVISKNINTTQPTSSAFMVSTDMEDVQGFHSVAMNNRGDFISAWKTYGRDVLSETYVRIYNSLGIDQGSAFKLDGKKYSRNPLVAMDSNKNFIIVWEGGSRAQLYDSSGTPRGPEFEVGAPTENSKRIRSVAMNDDGNFVIVWESWDLKHTDIYVQRYNSLGITQDKEFKVSTRTENSHREPSIAIDKDGNFIVVWLSSKNIDGTEVELGIYAQRYNSLGVAQGSEIKVNSPIKGIQLAPSIAMSNNGSFVIKWINSLGQNERNIYAQRYNSLGIAQGLDFQVNAQTKNIIGKSSVAIDDNGNFVIVWGNYRQDSINDIYAQCYNSSGIIQNPEFRVNADRNDLSASSSVAMSGNGKFVVLWNNTSSGNIYAQRYTQ